MAAVSDEPASQMNDADIRVDRAERRLHDAAVAAGAFVTGDGRVHEEVAAGLLGVAAGTLKNRRLAGSDLPFYRVGGGRITYSLRDLAELIERGRGLSSWED